MSIRITAAAFALALAAMAPTGAFAQANVMKECGAEYQTAKAANSLGGKKWNDFLSDCRTRKAAATPAAATTPAAAPPATQAATPAAPPASTAPTTGMSPASKTPSATTAAKPAASGGRAAMLDRQRTCGAEWKAQKIELRKANAGLKWPQYWSDCNKRLKAAAKS